MDSVLGPIDSKEIYRNFKGVDFYRNFSYIAL